MLNSITMAKIKEEIIIIKISQLTKNSDSGASAISDELLAAITEITEQLVGDNCVVEVETAE